MDIDTHMPSVPGVKSPRVALTGFYGYGNFGDDLMAVIFGRYLHRIGVPFSVLKLTTDYSGPFGFDVAHTIRELLEGADVLIWGGGGLLVPWRNWIYSVFYPGVGREYEVLIREARKKGIRLGGFSVGGTGDCPETITPAYKQIFMEEAEYISVRNPQDLAILRHFGVPGDYFPDLVWQAADHFPARRRKADRLRIGMDLYGGNLLRHNAAYLVPLLYALTRKRPDCDFVFMDTTNRTKKPYRGLGRIIKGSRVYSHQFSSPAADMEMLASLDLLVSTRLHTLVVCLQYGVPVLSLFGEKKTTLLMRNLGLARLCYSHRRMRDFFSLMRSKEKLARFIEEFSFPDISTLRRGSYGHLEKLQQFLAVS